MDSICYLRTHRRPQDAKVEEIQSIIPIHWELESSWWHQEGMVPEMEDRLKSEISHKRDIGVLVVLNSERQLFGQPNTSHVVDSQHACEVTQGCVDDKLKVKLSRH